MRRLEMSDAFALVLRRYRTAMKLTQEVLAEKADLHPTYVSLLERKLRNPTLNVSQALAKAMGISLTQLINEAELLLQKPK